MAAVKPGDRITCPHCQGSLKAPPLPVGSLCTCPKCGQQFPIGVSPTPPAKAPAPTPAPAATAPAPQPKPKTPPASAASPSPVRAELADPPPKQAPAAAPKDQQDKPAAAAPPSPVPMPATPVVTVSADDVIGQMLLGTPAPGPAVPRPEPTRSPAASPPVKPAAVAPAAATSKRNPPAPAPTPAPAPAALAATVLDDDDDRQLQAVLAAPAAARAGDLHLATSTTQPAHRQEPPPPKPPPAPRNKNLAEIPVVCKLCGTRMYARTEQVGTRMRCPDCHTENEVPAPKVAAPAAPPKPVSLDEGGDFVLGDVTQRPSYKPMVEPRGEYAGLKFLDEAAVPRRSSDNAAEKPAESAAPRHPTRAALTETTMTFSGSPPPDEDDDGEEIVVSAPVERIDTKQVVALPPPDDPDEDNQYRGRFRDEEWGFAADPNQKDAWKKSPFYYGIVGFLFYPQTLYRFILYSFVLTVDIAMFLGAVYCAQTDSLLLYAALGLTVSSAVLSAFVVGGSSPCLYAIANDTANGMDAVENWPDWNIAEWLLQALIIPWAAFLAALPGSLVATGCFALGREGMLFAPFPILASELMFFPILFGSMLAEGSFMPVSGSILRSMQRRGDGWLLFYCASILLGMVLGAAVVLVEIGVQAGTILVAPFAATLWVACLIVYFRLLGRLLWYVQNYRRERDRPE